MRLKGHSSFHNKTKYSWLLNNIFEIQGQLYFESSYCWWDKWESRLSSLKQKLKFKVLYSVISKF